MIHKQATLMICYFLLYLGDNCVLSQLDYWLHLRCSFLPPLWNFAEFILSPFSVRSHYPFIRTTKTLATLNNKPPLLSCFHVMEFLTCLMADLHFRVLLKRLSGMHAHFLVRISVQMKNKLDWYFSIFVLWCTSTILSTTNTGDVNPWSCHMKASGKGGKAGNVCIFSGHQLTNWLPAELLTFSRWAGGCLRQKWIP